MRPYSFTSRQKSTHSSFFSGRKYANLPRARTVAPFRIFLTSSQSAPWKEQTRTMSLPYLSLAPRRPKDRGASLVLSTTPRTAISLSSYFFLVASGSARYSFTSASDDRASAAGFFVGGSA